MSELTPISKSFKPPSQRDVIEGGLTTAATMRGAKLDKQTLSLYSVRLLREPFDDVMTALEQISEMPRKEFESALPDMGTVLELVKTCGIARHNREAAALDQELVGWKCQACKGTVSGYFPKSRNVAEEVRYCQRPGGQVRTGASAGEICGGNLIVVHRSAVHAEVSA